MHAAYVPNVKESENKFPFPYLGPPPKNVIDSCLKAYPHVKKSLRIHAG